MTSREFRGESRLTIRERLENILVNNGFTLLTPIWTQHGDYRKKTWDLAVWGATASFRIRDDSPEKAYLIHSFSTMTSIVKAGGIAWFRDGTNAIDISPREMRSASDLKANSEELTI